MLFEPLFAHASSRPAAVAAIDDRGEHTYAAVAGMAKGLASLFASRSNRPRIGLMLPAGAGYVASFYGALLAGKAVVPINFLLSDREIAHCIADSGIDAVVSVPPLAGRLKESGLNVIDLTQLPPAPAGADAEFPFPSPAADDLAVLMYTSGTSGLPKGVRLTYDNVQSNVDAAIAAAGFQRGQTFLGIVPLFHAFGMTAMMLAPVQLGATVVYLSRFSPVGTLNAIRERGVSIVGGMPSMYAAILRLKDASPADFRTIHMMISGAEPLPPTLREAFFARFGVPLYEAYGMTEASLAIAVNTPAAHRPGSVGRPVPGMRVRVVDEQGRDVPDGQEGEFWISGPMVTRGYNDLPGETAAAITPDGWFKTGDLGTRDADGFLTITGRKKDLIIVAGEKAAPREIEEALSRHPAVAEASVVGRKDASRGEVVVAFVMPKEGHAPTPEELREFARKSGLAQWKVPREVRIVGELPRSPTGKVLKRVLAERAATDEPNA